MKVVDHAISNQMTNQTPESHRLDWQPEHFEGFGRKFIVARHNLHHDPLFDWDSIVKLIDNYPRGQVQAFTMGADPSRFDQLVPVDTCGVDGGQILEAVRRGRLWFKLQRIDLAPGYCDIVRMLYEELATGCDDFRPHKWSAVLLFGSTNSQVYFHVDPKPNMLWHIWGRKRFWLYPPPSASGRYLISQDVLEDIFASMQDEETEYHESFDEVAKIFDLVPGDVLAWPQNSPHRVEVLEGISMSISSFYETDQSVRRGQIYGMNRILRTKLGLRSRSVCEEGLVPWAKALGFRAISRAGLLEKPSRRPYRTDLQIDGSSPTGTRKLQTGPRLTEFAKGSDL